jgi:outer membrane protein OmpA-like peptidoglycan-associated protein
MKKVRQIRAVGLVWFSLFAGFFLLIPLRSEAQRMVPTPEDQFAEALEYIQSGDYGEALPVLQTLRNRGMDGAGISYRIGECYLNLAGQKTKALSYLKQASAQVSESFKGDSPTENSAPLKTWLYLGIAFRLNSRFDDAEAAFNTYLRLLDPKDTLNQALAHAHLEKCRNARLMISAPAKVETDTLPELANMGLPHFNPMVTGNGDRLFYMDRLKFYDAPMMSRNTASGWEKPDNLTPELGSDGDHILTGVSADGNDFLFTYSDPVTGGDIYLCHFGNGKWGPLQKLGAPVNTQFNESHASFAPNGDLYFTSDRKGGFGGLDIYRAAKSSAGNWGNPVNLGPGVNTPFNEEAPFLSATGTSLFFCSQGHFNMGGFDIFRSDTDSQGTWQPPVNLGYPVNTVDDELFFFPSGNGESGYSYRFPSGSPQSCLVRIHVVSPANPARFTLHGKVNTGGRDGRGLQVRFTDAASNAETGRSEVKDGMWSQAMPAGDFTLSFTRNDSLFLQKSLHIPAFLPQTDLVVDADIDFPEHMKRDTLWLEDIRFAFDRTAIAPEYEKMLESLANTMRKYGHMRVTLSGYTDAKGDDAYNLKLSQARAEAVAARLKGTGDLNARISVLAFGEAHAVALNRSADGKDLEEGRKYNRRVTVQLFDAPDDLIIEMKNDIPTSLRAK